MIKVIIFDWGDVLHYVNVQGYCNELARKHKVDKAVLREQNRIEIMKLNRGLTNDDEFIANINRELNIKIGKKEARDVMFSKYIKPNKGILPIIEKLKESYSLHILSNLTPQSVKYIRKNTSFHQIFDRMWFSCEEKLAKPDPLLFKRVLGHIKSKPGECLFIDNLQRNLDAADKLGMKTILFKNNTQLKKDLKKQGIKI
jgi:epoxide hydrolase-like predicted phosphatase